jgi:hypothetical protein
MKLGLMLSYREIQGDDLETYLVTAPEAKHPAMKRTAAIRAESLTPSQYHAHRISKHPMLLTQPTMALQAM